jgi:hypothetical protein
MAAGPAILTPDTHVAERGDYFWVSQLTPMHRRQAGDVPARALLGENREINSGLASSRVNHCLPSGRDAIFVQTGGDCADLASVIIFAPSHRLFREVIVCPVWIQPGQRRSRMKQGCRFAGHGKLAQVLLAAHLPSGENEILSAKH